MALSLKVTVVGGWDMESGSRMKKSERARHESGSQMRKSERVRHRLFPAALPTLATLGAHYL